ncbi:MAG: serine/threonine protein kinase [Myxococcales bacterium]|nr:serine/threonine protein kinase [Myxococcales bacterium]
MKSCPKCYRTYPDDGAFCPQDGASLVSSSTLPAANAEDPRVGLRLCGRYEVRRIVADGGMGRVYEGIDKETNSRIAIKVLHEDVARDEVALARFKREYEISSQLGNDHVVRVLDFQRDPVAGAWILVMEFLDGEELRVVLKREKFLQPARLVRMVSHVAIGLDAAHAAKFIHRDLKPDNLFLCGSREGDATKILDFGSVKDKNANAKKLTVMGTTIGSPFYMAPEQAQGLDTLDARADVFALAAISYECMVGTVPFSGNNGPSILLAILTEDPTPPTQKGKDAKYPIPAAMDEVMELALAKNPNHRQPSVGAFADAIGHAYGLSGSHLEWAKIPLAELTKMLETAVPAAPRPAEADPFAAPARDPFGASAPPPAHAPSRAPAPAPSHHAAASQAPSGPARVLESPPDVEVALAGVPSKTPAWLVPAIAGGVVLVLAAVALLVLR